MINDGHVMSSHFMSINSIILDYACVYVCVFVCLFVCLFVCMYQTYRCIYKCGLIFIPSFWYYITFRINQINSPEALGIVPGAIFLICLTFCLVGYANSHPTKVNTIDTITKIMDDQKICIYIYIYVYT